MQRRLIYILLTAFLASCHSGGTEDEGPHSYFDAIFSRADSLGSDRATEAFSLLDSAFHVFPHSGLKDLYRKYGYKLQYYYEKKNYPKALLYVDSQLYIIRDKTDQRDYGPYYYKALFDKGDIYLNEKNYPDAFQYYFKGKQAIEKTGDTCGFNIYSSRLGQVCFLQGKYRDAILYFTQNFEELTHCRQEDAFTRFVNTQGSLDNIALSYGGAGMEDSALFYYDSAAHFIQANQNAFSGTLSNKRFVETALGVVLGNEGDLWYRKGNNARAEAMLLKSIALNRQKEHAFEDAQINSGKLAGVYLADNKPDLAKSVLQDLRHTLDSVPSQSAELRWSKMQWQYYEKTGKVAEAYRYMQDYIRLKDLSGNQGDLAGMDIEGQIRHMALGYQLTLLKKEDELKTVCLVIVLLFIAMSTGIILLVWKNGKRSRQHLIQLTGLNQRISVQHEHMQKTLSALEQSQRENARLIKIMAHDLRNPIGAGSSIATLLLEEPDITGEQRQMLELIRNSSSHSLEMITDLLHANTTIEGMKKESIDLPSLLQYCLDELRFKADEKQQQIHLQAEPIILLVNREKIWRVLSNLITNAIKFSPPDKVITIDLHQEGSTVLLSIKDQGIGIPPELGEQVFDLFSESKRPGTSGEESFGLGLYISKQIVEAHGGKIWFISVAGRGTTFYVALPTD